MTPSAIALVVFGCTFGAALVGMLLHVKLPDHHLDSESKDVVKLVMSLIATMAALVLSLLIASANSSYQAQSSELQSLSANVVLLDRLLAYYGPDANEARHRLHEALQVTHDRIWPPENGGRANLDPRGMQDSTSAFVERLQSLAPKTDAQRAMQSQALQVGAGIAQTRLLMFQQIGGSISWPFLAIMIFWISMLFLGFGLFARLNATVTVALLVGAISVSGAIFLMLELSEPYQGLMRISDVSLRGALAQTDQ